MAMKKQNSPPTLEQLKLRAEAYCMRAEHCKHEVQSLLKRHGGTDQQIDTIIRLLEQDRFIDEARYATAFARDKHRFAHWGTLRIARELHAKRISQEKIENALQIIREEFDTVEDARRLILKKYNSMRQSDRRKVYAGLMRFGLYRGYDYELLHKIIGDVMQSGEE